MDSTYGDWIPPAGLPHSDIRGSRDICSSPRLFAACHVLRRLLMPGHSPCALSSLTSGPLLRVKRIMQTFKEVLAKLVFTLFPHRFTIHFPHGSFRLDSSARIPARIPCGIRSVRLLRGSRTAILSHDNTLYRSRFRVRYFNLSAALLASPFVQFSRCTLPLCYLTAESFPATL